MIKIIFFTYLFLLSTIRCDSIYSEYVIISLFEDFECSNQSYFETWIFSADRCNNFGTPFGRITNHTYIDSTNSIEFYVFEDFGCSTYANETYSYSVGECYNVENEEGIMVFAEFSITNDSSVISDPVNEKWTVENYYQDPNCTDMIPDFLHSFSKAAMRHLSTEEIEGDGLSAIVVEEGGIVLGYCTDEYFVDVLIGLPARGVKTYEFWRKVPRKFENQCRKAMDRFFGWNSKVWILGDYSMRRCMTQEEVENDYFSTIPSQSTEEYLKLEFNYDDECERDYFQISIIPTDVCIYENNRLVATDYEFHRMFYPQSDCGDEMYMILSHTYQEPEACVLFENNSVAEDPSVLFDSTTYCTEYMDSDPFFPTQVAALESYHQLECKFSTMDQVKASPGVDAYLTYYNERTCLPFDDIFSEEIPYKSMKGKCVDGVLELTLYTESHLCLGDYFVWYGDVCLELTLGTLIATCIPRTCLGVSELSDFVCNGHGSCILKDVCECEEGYVGDSCSSWVCHDIEKDDEDVCSGHGACVELDVCECDFGYYMIDCGTSYNWIIVTSTTLGSLFGVSTLTTILCCCVCVYVVFPLCFFLSFFVLTLMSGGSVITYYQRRKLSKFEQLENFDLLLKEQMIEEDQSTAHLNVNKVLFEIPFEEIKSESVLGEGGSNSVVYKAKWRGQFVAFKCFKTRHLLSTQDRFDEFEKEVELLSSLFHPYIIRFYGATLKPPRVGIVMEFASKGEILRFMLRFEDESGCRYPMFQKIRMMIQSCSAIEFLHSRKIIHRDIKSENILIDEKENTKLMDFGLSRLVDSFSVHKTVKVGTSAYMAPEVVNDVTYTEKCDMFSFGILMYVLLTQKNDPYDGIHHAVEMKVANDPKFRPNTSDLVNDLDEDHKWMKNVIVRCWDASPKMRFSFKELREILENKDSRDKILLDEKIEDSNESDESLSGSGSEVESSLSSTSEVESASTDTDEEVE